MPKLTILMLAVLAAVLAAVQPFAAQAASSVCRTVNGRTVCTQSGDALSCQTVNGQTQCLSGSGTLRCDTVNGRTTCSTTRGTPAHPIPGPIPSMPDDLSEDWDPVPVPRGPDVDIRDGELRVRAGTLDLRLGRFP